MVGTCLPSSGFRSSNSEKKEYVSKGLQLVKQNSRLQGNAHNTLSRTCHFLFEWRHCHLVARWQKSSGTVSKCCGFPFTSPGSKQLVLVVLRPIWPPFSLGLHFSELLRD